MFKKRFCAVACVIQAIIIVMLLMNGDKPMQHQDVSSEIQPNENHKPKNLTDLSVPNWDCTMYHCGDNNKNIYPASNKIINRIASLKGRSFSKNPDQISIDLIVGFDPTCSNCKLLNDKVLLPLLDAGYRIHVFPTTYRDIETLNAEHFDAFKSLVCGKKSDILSIYLPLNDPECEDDEIRHTLQQAKIALAPFGINSATPLIFTQKSIIIGFKDLNTIRRYL